MSLSLEKEFGCPYCGSANFVSLDITAGRSYQFVTDCETCCRPVVVHVSLEDGDCFIDVHAENE